MKGKKKMKQYWENQVGLKDLSIKGLYGLHNQQVWTEGYFNGLILDAKTTKEKKYYGSRIKNAYEGRIKIEREIESRGLPPYPVFTKLNKRLKKRKYKKRAKK